MNNKWLITIDLDGTMLVKEKPGESSSFDVHPDNITAVNKLIEQGHAVAIVTGRPWRDTKTIYQDLDLDTVIGNFNGAFIHNPTDKGFVNQHQTINRKLLAEFVKHPHISNVLQNWIVEDHVNTNVINASDSVMMKQFHVSNDPALRSVKSIDEVEYDPYSMIGRLDNKIDKESWMEKAKELFGTAFALRYWIRDDNYYLEVNAKNAHKANAMKQLAAYYNIDMKHTIAFGDGENDVEMLEEAAHGVAMLNASDFVKSFTDKVTDFDNNNGGVGKYLNKFFGLK